jgi:hypothetical protein
MYGVESCGDLVDYAGFEFLNGDTWRETLAFKADERRRQRRKQSIQYVYIGFEWQFWNKIKFIPKLGAYVNPKFWRVRNCPWA